MSSKPESLNESEVWEIVVWERKWRVGERYRDRSTLQRFRVCWGYTTLMAKALPTIITQNNALNRYLSRRCESRHFPKQHASKYFDSQAMNRIHRRDPLKKLIATAWIAEAMGELHDPGCNTCSNYRYMGSVLIPNWEVTQQLCFGRAIAASKENNLKSGVLLCINKNRNW